MLSIERDLTHIREGWTDTSVFPVPSRFQGSPAGRDQTAPKLYPIFRIGDLTDVFDILPFCPLGGCELEQLTNFVSDHPDLQYMVLVRLEDVMERCWC